MRALRGHASHLASLWVMMDCSMVRPDRRGDRARSGELHASKHCKHGSLCSCPGLGQTDSSKSRHKLHPLPDSTR